MENRRSRLVTAQRSQFGVHGGDATLRAERPARDTGRSCLRFASAAPACNNSARELRVERINPRWLEVHRAREFAQAICSGLGDSGLSDAFALVAEGFLRPSCA